MCVLGFANIRSSHPEVLFAKVILKICSKFTGEHPCRSVISIKLLCDFIENLYDYLTGQKQVWLVFCVRDVLKIRRKAPMNENFKNSYADRALLDEFFWQIAVYLVWNTSAVCSLSIEILFSCKCCRFKYFKHFSGKNRVISIMKKS